MPSARASTCKLEFHIARCSLLLMLLPNGGYRHSPLQRNVASKLNWGFFDHRRVPNWTQQLCRALDIALQRVLVCSLDHIPEVLRLTSYPTIKANSGREPDGHLADSAGHCARM
jgi:hypothetical protein